MAELLPEDPRVIVLDDERVVASECAEFLSEAGIACVAAHSPNEVDYLLRKHPSVGIILVDLKMPGLCGIDVIRNIRRTFPDRPLHFALMSGLATPDELNDAVAAGISTFIQKPKKAKALLLEIHAMLKDANFD